MITWLRNRRFINEQRRLERLHLQLLEQARDLQRSGDICGFAGKTSEAAAVEQQLDAWLASRDAASASDPKR